MAPPSLLINVAFDSGEHIEAVPRGFKPLGVADLRRLEENPSAGLELVFNYEQLKIDGRDQPGGGTATMNIVFSERARIYALVPGGCRCLSPSRRAS